MRRLLPHAVVLVYLTGTADAATHRYTVHANPAIKIFGIAEGPDGLLWLAASDGLYRFDGLHYHKIPEYPFTSARTLAFTGDGSLWVGDFSGLARYRNGEFKTVVDQTVVSLVAYPDQVFANMQGRLARIGLDGTVQHLDVPTRRDLSIDFSGTLWAMCHSLPMGRACAIDAVAPRASRLIDVPPQHRFEQALRDGLGRLWVADAQRAVLARDDRAELTVERLSSSESSRAAPLVSGQNGQVWFIGEIVRGLTRPLEFSDREDNNRYRPLSGFEDRHGHVWTSSTGRGLVEWHADESWERWFPEDFGNETPTQVLREPQGSIVVATDKHLHRYDPAKGTWSRITKQEQFYYYVFALGGGEFLVSTRDAGVLRISRDGMIVERIKDPTPEPYFYRKIFRDAQGTIWVGTKRALLRVAGKPGSLSLVPKAVPELSTRENAHAVDFELDRDGRLWVGYANGLAWLDERDVWHKLPADKPVSIVRAFTLAGDNIWVSHRRAGEFSLLRKNGEGWYLQPFPAADGYGPPTTQYLKTDSRGWIWRGSSDGVHISDGRRYGVDDWIHLNLKNGLASSETAQYGFFEDMDGSIWVTGDEGVTHLKPNPTWFEAPRSARTPRVTQVDADGRVDLCVQSPPSTLPSGTKVLRVDFGALDAPPFRDAPLRYRLLPHSARWHNSRDGSVQFQGLGNGSYALEIAYAGDGTSAAGVWRFQIGSVAPFTSWYWSTTAFAGVGLLVVIVRRIPWLEGVNFRINKGLFLLRRRYGRKRRHSSSPSVDVEPENYCGQLLCERYLLTDVLSRGGFSVVYAAEDLLDRNTRVAVKMLNRDVSARGDSWVRNRFAHEVAALRSVQHPAVVGILDSWIAPTGAPCLAMPFLDGETLRDVLVRGPLRPARTAVLAKDIASGLAALHQRGMVHRDLKPENIIVQAPGTEREHAVIIDLGIAGLRQAEYDLAVTTLMAGSFHYMAPERLTGHYSPASDVFSLAVIILEMLTGKRLGDLNAMCSDPTFRAELESVLRPQLESDMAVTVADLLRTACSLEPRQRPSAVDLWTGRVAAALVSVDG